jgi:hypothetical protein
MREKRGRGLRIDDPARQSDAPLQPAVKAFPPSIPRAAAHDPRPAIPNSRQSVELHIDELVLHGFSPSDRYPIADAIQRELTRLFIQEGLPPSVAVEGEVARVDGGAFRVAASGTQESRQESAGERVARAIYGGLRR